jgi:NADH oxidase (H2O2-forming)
VRITLISDESHPLYSPCAFHKYLACEMEKERLFLKKLADYEREGIHLIAGERVEAVDVEKREVNLAAGRPLSYDRLILATGSRPILPPVPGIDKVGVFVPKTMGDAEAIFHYPARHVAVVGSGPIGIETAAAFRKRGAEVHVIEMLDRILPRLFDEPASSMLKGVMEENGIRVLTGETVTEIMGDRFVKGLKTRKREIECNLVIMAAGARCNTDLAEQMGIRTGSFGGISTDHSMRTSLEGIYACGDCIESTDMVTGERSLSLLWSSAKRQGWIAGSNCAGVGLRYTGSLNATTLEVFGTYAASVGPIESDLCDRSEYEVTENLSDREYGKGLIVANRLVGMQLINSHRYAGFLVSKMLRKDDLQELRAINADEKLVSMRPWHYLAGRCLRAIQKPR